MGTNHPFDLFNGGGFSRRWIIDPQSGQPVEAMPNRAWLESRSKDKLVGYVLDLARKLELDRREPSTVDIPLSVEPQPLNGGPAHGNICACRPSRESHAPRPANDLAYQLYPLDGQYAPLGIELSDDVVVGGAVHGIYPNLDLMPYGAEELGVSRLHAMLRPTKARLLDLVAQTAPFAIGSVVVAARPWRCRIMMLFGSARWLSGSTL